MNREDMRGLLAIWAGIDADYVLEYRKWQNCQHMTERVTIPGFYVGRRYQSIHQETYFLMMYETSNARVLESKPYLKALNSSTSWTREALSHYNDTVRAIYSLICTAGEMPLTDAPFLLNVKFDCVSETAADTLRVYSQQYLPKMCDVDGVYRGRLYEVDSGVSRIQTSEGKIHGAGPGRERYLAIFEMASVDIVTGAAWKAAQMPEDRDGIRKFGKLDNRSQELFWLDFMMYAPGRHT